jgi:hypothetical protein
MRLPRLPVPAVVALGFMCVVAIGVLIAYLLRDIPSEQESCNRLCSKSQRSGQLVPVYPGGSAKTPMRCECI